MAIGRIGIGGTGIGVFGDGNSGIGRPSLLNGACVIYYFLFFTLYFV